MAESPFDENMNDMQQDTFFESTNMETETPMGDEDDNNNQNEENEEPKLERKEDEDDDGDDGDDNDNNDDEDSDVSGIGDLFGSDDDDYTDKQFGH